jgi:hypothetical protein
VKCGGSVEVEPEEDTVWDGEMGRFLLEFLVDGASFVVSRMVATTENTSDIIRAFRSVTVLCGVITCALDASWFQMVVVCVSVSLAVCTLNNIPFVLGRFKFDFAQLEVFDKVYILVVRGRFQLHRKHGKRELGAILFHIPYVGYRVSQFLYFCFDICRIDGVLHVLKHYSVGMIFFRFVCVELSTFLGQGFDYCPIIVRGCWLNIGLVVG